jgi:hypothetical protein
MSGRERCNSYRRKYRHRGTRNAVVLTSQADLPVLLCRRRNDHCNLDLNCGAHMVLSEEQVS